MVSKTHLNPKAQAMHRKHKRLELGVGQAYDRSSD
jgi:hypothetical protein